MFNKLEKVAIKLAELENHLAEIKNSIKNVIEYVQNQDLESDNNNNKEFTNGKSSNEQDQ
jgi:hypothetical protein